MELVEDVKALLVETAKSLKGSARRLFMARAVHADGEKVGSRWQNGSWGGIVGRSASGSMNWSMGSSVSMHIPHEVASRVEEHLPNLLNDITALVDGKTQADPQFRTNRLYTRLTATQVRRQFITQKGYRDVELPTAETIAAKLNGLG